ncbi:MAG: hypothetical protein ACREDT_13135 [Methylocella sp.]
MGKAGEKQKRTPKTKDKRQYEQFVETARELGCDESEEKFAHSFEKIMPVTRRIGSQKLGGEK